jgi:hypothetical protein
MSRGYTRQVKYDLIKGGATRQRRIATIDCVDVPQFPVCSTLEEMFTRAISGCGDGTLRQVLTDLLRCLVHSNHVGFGPAGDRAATLSLLDAVHPHTGQIPEAERPYSYVHRSGQTDTCGAVLDLLLRTQASAQVKEKLGGILLSLMANDTVVRRKPSPYIPVIETGG